MPLPDFVPDADAVDLLITEHGGDVRAALETVLYEVEALRRLERIVHPLVHTAERRFIAKARRQRLPIVVRDVPLLFEVGLDRSVDVTLAVTAPLAARAARVRRRSGLSEEQVRQRDASQMSQEEKAARADHVIDNSGSEADLEREVARLWPELLARRATGN